MNALPSLSFVPEITIPARRLTRAVYLAVTLVTWEISIRTLSPWFQRLMGFRRIASHDVATVVGHWFAWQLPAVIPCVLVWWIGERLGLMPSFTSVFKSGGSWSRVVRAGLMATIVLLFLTLTLGKAVGGTFQFQPYVPKMIGDVVSNMYEEIINRGFFFAAFYGLAAGATFPLSGKLHRGGLALGTIGSCIVFASGHTQYPLPLRVLLGVVAAVAFVWPWVRARSLWAPWIPHTLGDFIADTILRL
jgi:hypothetical protein